MSIPAQLAERWGGSEAGRAWLELLPHAIAELADRWSLRLGNAFAGPEVTASWVADVERADGTPAILKIGIPHMEAQHEIDGLRFWDGDPTVRLLDADVTLNAMLLERCVPGTPLRSLPEEDQDVVVAGLLRRLWQAPPDPHPFRPLSVMIDHWVAETRANEHRWSDPDLVSDGLEAFEMLAHQPVEERVLLATDLHAGNVLAAEREPWLVIDPKPFVGDRTYDATQHLLNGVERLRRDPTSTIARFARLLDADADRLRRWLFARVAAETRDDRNEDWDELARALRP
jgi:streptomycin 6-kinase